MRAVALRSVLFFAILFRELLNSEAAICSVESEEMILLLKVSLLHGVFQ